MGLPREEGPSFIAYAIATGGDPFNFSELAQPHPLLWVWILIVHVLSWLIVPVLAATAIDAAYRKWEERREELEVELQSEMCGVIERQLGLGKEEADLIAAQLLHANKRLAIKRRRQ